MVVDRRALSLHKKLVEDAVERGEQQQGLGSFPREAFAGAGGSRPVGLWQAPGAGPCPGHRELASELRRTLGHKQLHSHFLEKETEAPRGPRIYPGRNNELAFELGSARLQSPRGLRQPSSALDQEAEAGRGSGGNTGQLKGADSSVYLGRRAGLHLKCPDGNRGCRGGSCGALPLSAWRGWPWAVGSLLRTPPPSGGRVTEAQLGSLGNLTCFPPALSLALCAPPHTSLREVLLPSSI